MYFQRDWRRSYGAPIRSELTIGVVSPWFVAEREGQAGNQEEAISLSC